MSADPYVYPDSNVLRNLQGIRDPDQLRQVEANLTRLRALRIAAEPIPAAMTSRTCSASTASSSTASTPGPDSCAPLRSPRPTSSACPPT